MTTLDKYLKYETSYINRQITNSTDTWKTYTWQEIAIPIRKKIKKTEYKGEYPIVKKISFDRGEIVLREERKTKTDLYIAPPQTLIVSKINLHQGAVAINNLGWITCTTHYDVYKINEKIVDIKFLWYYLRSPIFRKKIYDDLKYRGIKKEANYKYLKNIKLKLPPIEEQRKIVYILDTIKHAIEIQDRLLDTLNELKRALMNRLFTKGLDPNQPTKQTEIGEIPAHWKVLSLGDILVKIQYGLSMKGHKDNSGYPLLRMNNIVDGRIILNDLQYVKIDYKTLIKFKLEKGDLLFNRTNSPDLVGKTAIFDIDGTYVFASYLIRLRVNSRMANPYFINYYLNWDKTQIRIKKLASRGVSQANVSATKLKTLKIALPPLDEQEQIVNILRTIDEKISIIEKKRSILQELFDVMLHKLMNGQIRVTNLDEIYSSKRPSGM